MLGKKLFSSAISALFLSMSFACSDSNLSAPELDLTAQNVQMMATTKVKPSNPEKEITVATYNVENLFDGVQNKGKAAEKPKSEEQLKALSASMHDINADVIALQEVESRATLKKFKDTYLSDMNYEIVLREGNDPRGIDVAVLTRLKVADVKSHKNVKINVPNSAPQTFSRDLLQVRLVANAKYTFSFFVTHLKSQIGGDDADAKRKAEVQKIREFMRDYEKQNKRSNYILAGDFNDVPSSESLQPILDPRASGLALHDIVWEDLGSGPDVFSFHPQEHRSRIDYILPSFGMHADYIKNSVQIHKAPKNGGDPNMFFNASDHLPITAKFNVSKDL